MFAKGNREESERNDCLEGSFQFQFQFRREKREGIVLRKLRFDMHNHKRRRSDQEFPPKCPTRCRFGDHFPPKSPHDSVLGTKFPTKFPTLDRLILSYFGFSGLMDLGFFSTSDINVCIMGYYMTMGLGFFFAISDINVCIMGYYITMGLGFFFQPHILMYVLWVII